MPQPLTTPSLSLTPVGTGDADRLCALLREPDVRRYLCDDALLPRADIEASIAASLDPADITAFWRIDTRGSPGIGLIGLRPPSHAALALRAIGWRSLELIVALEPGFWGYGLAREAVEAVAARAGADGVTFALVAAVDEPNERSHRLMRRCGFEVLGCASGPRHALVVYERAV